MTAESGDGSAAHIGANDADLEPGQQVGEYVVDCKVGEGGFGKVFKATHPLIGKEAAIKVLSRQYSSQPDMVSRFVSEARAVNQIRHRNIIDIFSFGQLPDGRHYYVMEYAEIPRNAKSAGGLVKSVSAYSSISLGLAPVVVTSQR